MALLRRPSDQDRRAPFDAILARSPAPDDLAISFDDAHAVANAGLLLAATLSERLGIEQAADELIGLGERPGAGHPGSKLATLVHAMVPGRTASTTPMCCAVVPPRGCWATG